jgi:hypothetical protein
MAKVNLCTPFLGTSKTQLDQVIDIVVHLYASVATQGNLDIAKQKLAGYVHERVVFYRNTIWKDMIESERRKESVGLKPAVISDESGDLFKTYQVQFFGQSWTVPILPKKLSLVLAGMAAFGLLILFPVFSAPEQNNCFAILVFVSYLWALEVSFSHFMSLCFSKSHLPIKKNSYSHSLSPL